MSVCCAECMLRCSFSLRKFSLLVNNFLASLCWSQIVFTEYFSVSLSVIICLFQPSSSLSLLCFYPLSPRPFWIQELLMFKVSGSTNSSNNPPHLVNFDLGSESHVDTASFDPLHQFDHIGKKRLEQVCHLCIFRLSSQFMLIAYYETYVIFQ